jgi:hypothetical protein
MRWWKVKESGTHDKWEFALGISTPYEYSPSNPHNVLKIYLFKKYWFIRIPELIKPKFVWVDTSKYDWAKPGPDGRCGYNDDIQRSYGFTTFDDALHIYYGIQPGSWSSRDKKNSDHTKVIYFPWREWERDRIEFLNLDKTVFSVYRDKKNGALDFTSLNEHQEKVPKVVFAFNDFDGEEIQATCHLEVSHYHLGKGLFKFLRLFKKRQHRTMDIRFSKEIGYEKNSWKGGTVGHSIEFLPSETPLETFTRYGTSEDRYRHHGTKNRGFTNIRIVDSTEG